MKFFNQRNNTVFGVKISYVLIGIILLMIIKNAKSLFALPTTIYTDVKEKLFGDSESSKAQKEISEALKKQPDVKQELTVSTKVIAEDIAKELTGFGYSLNKIVEAFKKIQTPAQMKAVYVSYGQRKNTLFFPKTDLIQGIKNKLWQKELDRDVSSYGDYKVSILDKLNWIA